MTRLFPLACVLLCACGPARIEAILAEYDTFGSTDAPDSTSTGTTSGTTGSPGSTTGSESTSIAETGTDTSSTTSAATSDSEASSTGPTAPYCGDGIVDPDESCDDMNDDPDDGCKLCTRDHIVFASSVLYQGQALNGLYGADQRCRMLAALAMLPNVPTYRAWLSDSTTAAADRITHSKGRYILVNGLVVAADWTALITGPLENPINTTESSGDAGVGGVWTGSLPNGQRAFGSSFCNDWSGEVTEEKGGSGVLGQTDDWWSFFQQAYCPSESAIYCFEN